MKKHRLVLSIASVFSIIFLFSSCKKINEATTLGGDLIPPVDNITTFDTTIDVETYNDLFSAAEDSLAKSVPADIQFFGNINNDPVFGKTEASAYFQLKPSLFKYSFPFSKDSLISLDSVVLVMRYSTTYGDTTIPQQVGVYEIPNSESFRHDSSYSIYKNPFSSLGEALSPVKTLIPQTLNDSVFPYHEVAANQVRIPLYNSFGQRLLNYDSTNAYASDSAFNTFFNGFAVVPQNNGIANALIGVNLSDTNTKLSFYVRYTKNGVTDTSVINFKLTSYSAAANYIQRDYSGSQLASYIGGTDPDDLVFIQGVPGSYATIKIPGLRGISNRIVHRAELIVEQVADPLDNIFPPPSYLYLDAYDSSKNIFRTIPYDFTFSSTGIPSASTFGMIGKTTTDVSGNEIAVWKFNISRYIQHVVNSTEPVYNLRLSAPFIFRETYKSSSAETPNELVYVNPSYAIGRVRVGGGNHPTQRMRLHIIYSKL